MKKSLTSAAVLCAAAFSLTSAVTVAQVDVVESTPRMPGSSSASSTSIDAPQPAQAAPGSQASPQNVQAEMFYRLQILQQEVQSLRGLVEEQAYELKRLKQQRLDDYVNLDRRLTELSGSASAASVATDNGAGSKPLNGSAVAASAATQTTAQAPDEMQRYRTAIDLVLRKKDYDRAVTAFNQYLRDFPQGRYAPNCQYWLGEIYLLQSDLEQAREWFSRLIADFPSHGKTSDAKFKLGTVYFKLGEKDQAKSLLEEVAQGDSNAARLAASFLSENF